MFSRMTQTVNILKSVYSTFSLDFSHRHITPDDDRLKPSQNVE